MRLPSVTTACPFGRYLAVILVLTLGACVRSRSVHDLHVPSGAAAQSSAGPTVVIEAVDARAFEAKPDKADVPSLKYAEEITKSEITSRAYGRKRGSFGGAKGDFVMPEGRSVPQLVTEVVGQALSQRGYKVVGPQDPAAASASKVKVTIEQFWSYLRPGFFVVAVDFVARLRIEGDMVGSSGPLLVEGKDQMRRMMLTEGRWIGLVERGLGGLSTAVAEKLPTVGGVATAAAGETATTAEPLAGGTPAPAATPATP
ncbi:MAG: hypothetical protein QM778_33425 [Myxococcales bacterium]